MIQKSLEKSWTQRSQNLGVKSVPDAPGQNKSELQKVEGRGNIYKAIIFSNGRGGKKFWLIFSAYIYKLHQRMGDA